MSRIADAVNQGDLDGAITAATADVRARPADLDARWRLAELHVLAGDLERADRSLDAVLGDAPIPAVLEFRQLLRAEAERRDVTLQGRAPHYQGRDATAAQQAAARARMLLRAGDRGAAREAVAACEDARDKLAGTLVDDHGHSIDFDDLRDADDLWCSELDVLTTSGDCLLVPWARILALEFEKPRRPRDLVWRRCTIDLRDGSSGVVYVPATYPGLTPADDVALRLGRRTDWVGDEDGGPVQGRGQRLWLAGDEGIALASVASVAFA